MPHTKFVFIDETGTLSSDPEQPYFASGLLKIRDTQEVYKALSDVKSRAMSRIQGRRGGRQFEFKFSRINSNNLCFYEELVDLFCDFPDLHFSCFAINKEHPRFDLKTHFPTIWDAYINFSRMQVKRNCEHDESVVVLADNITKPKASTRFYEEEIRSLHGVENAVLLESHASLFIQLVDVLVGCVIGDLKNVGGCKARLCKHLKRKYRVGNWIKNTYRRRPNTFRVWHFTPK